jgi:hypothetical protein
MPSVPNHPFDAYQGNDPYIFVSYCHADGEKVFAELSHLNRLGYRVWYDEGIDPGNEWPLAIARALERAALFIVFVSESAVKSDNVKNEIEFALKKKKPFLAVHLAETEMPVELDFSMGRMQALLRWKFSEEQFERLLSRAVPDSIVRKPGEVAPMPSAGRRTAGPLSVAPPPAPVPDEKKWKYWAFISHSHMDKEWGEWLHSELETYEVPPELNNIYGDQGLTFPKRIFPIFRDLEEIPTGSASNAIHYALRASKYLLVICSPKSAQSAYVNAEVAFFKALRGEDNVLCVIVEGEPYAPEGHFDQECFPPAIRHKVGADRELLPEHAEPVAADVRPGHGDKEKAKLSLIAAILGVGRRHLRQIEELRRRRRIWRYCIVGGSVILIGLAVFWCLQHR